MLGIGSSLEKILSAADVISEVRKAFEKIQNLETGQKSLADALDSLDRRVRELEASLREVRSEVKLEAVEAAHKTVDGAQGHIYQRMVDLEIKVSKAADSLEMLRHQPDSLRLPK